MPELLQKQTALTHSRASWIYTKMIEIRKFENKVHELVNQGKIPGLVHLYAGEEAGAVGICAHLNESDIIVSTHRGHGHCIAKGGDLNGMMAELFGKATGLCKGKGGSMHISDFSKGMLGANGIVGGNIPLACGAGLAAKLNDTSAVTVCFLGDGANNQGTFHESLNLASVWNLPIIFVVENNGFGAGTSFSYASSCEKVSNRASSYNIPSVFVDGLDVLAVYQAAQTAIEQVRTVHGPILLELNTYRIYGHLEGDPQKYKTAEERELYETKLDAISRFRSFLIQENIIDNSALQKIDESVDIAVQDAVIFAEQSPYPSVEELYRNVYSTY